jgi:hypothetical protein
MRTTWITVLGYALLGNVGSLNADEKPAPSKIVAVDLFKNGLAVVRREVTLGKSGVCVVDDVPEPVHGTYWVESNVPIETVVQMREVEVPVDETYLGDLQEDLAGQKVTIHLKKANFGPMIGTIAKLKPMSPGDPGTSGAGYSTANAARFLVVQSPKGRVFLDPGEIVSIATDGPDEKVKRRKPRLVLTVDKPKDAETHVRISYLARGLGWAPSYKIDITDPKVLVLEQQAVIKNELADLSGAEVRLISGFPSVQFANVSSPMATRTTWATFFQELGQRPQLEPGSLSNLAMNQQQAVFVNTTAAGLLSPVASPAGEGVDLHYQSIGKRSLAVGDSLSLPVAKAKADYDRIVEWLVPDTRDEWGRHVEGRGRGEDSDDSAWDALKFKNPLSFPMTTGPALVTSGGRFNGQRTSYWANAGEETVVRIDKALSIRTRSVEHEERKTPDDGRDLVWIGGRQYHKSTVEGELAISNHRAEDTQLVIRRRFSGELVEADGKPRTSLREEGAYSVNRRSELVWELPLKAGENRVLKYRYTVLVAR